MNSQQKFELTEKLKEIVSEMNLEIDCVVVEGMNDKQALKRLGFENNVVYAQERPTFRNNEKIAILTDFDSEGEFLLRKLTERLKGKVRINYVFRERFRDLLTPIGRRDIESINNLLDF